MEVFPFFTFLHWFKHYIALNTQTYQFKEIINIIKRIQSLNDTV